MKLHLPKALFAAVLSAIAALATAWGATTVESKTLSTGSATYDMPDANVIIDDFTVESGVTGTVNFASTNKNTQITHLDMQQEEGATTKLSVRAMTCDLLIIDDLTGAGQIEFNRASGNDDWGYAVLLKDSDATTPNFTGTLSLQNSNVVGNSMHLYLMSENAAKDATIELRQRTTLAVSASTAKIAGLQGKHDQAAVISFANPNGTTGADVNFDTNTGNCYNQNNSRDTNDSTERTLVLTGSGEYSYAGRIGSSGTNNTLNLKVAMGEGGKQTLSGTNFLKKLTVTSGDLVLSGDTTVATYTEGNYTVQDGTLTISGNRGGTASFGNVTVKEGGTLKLVSTDATGWNNRGTASILLQGNGDNLATLALGNRQTTSIDITLAGSSRITSTQTNESDLDMFGGKISASGTNNVINAAISTRANVEFAVAEGGSLDVNGKMDSFSRTDGGAGTVTKTGAGILTLNGTGSLFRNGIVVSGGELVFGGGSSTIEAGKTISIAEGASVTVANTLSLGGGLTGDGTFTTADGAAMHVGGATANTDIHHAGGEIVFDGTLTMGEGKTLYLGSGFSVDINDLSGFSSSGTEYVDASGNRSSEAHGFVEGTFSLVTGGTIDGSSTYKVAGRDWTLDNDNRTFTLSGAESRTSYLMQAGNEDSLSAIQTASEGHLATVVMNGGTLTVDSALAEGQGISIQGASTLSITEGTVLDKASVHAVGGTSTVTLDGAGEYVLGSPNLSETLAPGWTGIISVSGTKDAINLNSYANDNSKVKLNGLAGWMAMSSLTTSKELIMGEGADGAPAFKITAMSNSKTIKFTNKISGHGVFEVCDNNNASGDTVEFSGDVSGWDGTLKYNVTGTNAKTLKFSGSATEVNVGIENAAGTANVEIANDAAVTVNSSFTTEGTTNLKLTGAGVKTFTKDVTVASTTIEGGQMEVSNGSTFTTGVTTIKQLGTDNAVVSVNEGATDAQTVGVGNGNLTFGAADITVNSDADVAINAKLDGSKLSVKGADGTAATDATVTVNVEEGSTNDFNATDGSITVNAQTASIGTAEVGAGKTLTIGDGTGTATITTEATVAGEVAGNVIVASKATYTAQEDSMISGDVEVQSQGNYTADAGSIVGGNVTVANQGNITLTSTDGLLVAGNLNLASGATLTATSIMDVTGKEAGYSFVLATVEGTIDATNLANVTVSYIGTLGENLEVVLGVRPFETYGALGTPQNQLVATLTSTQVTPPASDVTYAGAQWKEGALLVTVDGTLDPAAAKLALLVTDAQWKEMVQAVTSVEGQTVGTPVGITLTDGATTIDLTNPGAFTGTVSFNGYVGEGNGLYEMQFIPEPATGTLSVLALAALAARRRRKH